MVNVQNGLQHFHALYIPLTPVISHLLQSVNFSMKYFANCEVYTGECGIQKLYHSLSACTVDNPLAKACGLSPRTCAHYYVSRNLIVVHLRRSNKNDFMTKICIQGSTKYDLHAEFQQFKREDFSFFFFTPPPTHFGLMIYRFFAWAWLAKSKTNVVIPKNQPLLKYLRKKTSKSAKYHLPLRYKKRPVKITMCLGIIIKLKFTTDFDRCAILNVLNYLT